MQTQDARGLGLTTRDPRAIAAIDNFAVDLLGMGPDTARILDAAEQAPDCGLLQTYAGFFHMYALTEAGRGAANDAFSRARRLEATPRERALLEAGQAWHDGDYEAAMDRCEAITQQWPRDVVAAKIAEFGYFLAGQHWNAGRFLTHMQRIIGDNPDNPYLLAMFAFAQELSGHQQAAQTAAEVAIDRERRNPWAHHALAHIHTRRGDPEAGIALLEDLKDTWYQSGSAIRVHNFWHLALLYLDRRDIAAAVRLHREEIFVRDREVVGIQIDAIALLWRMELAGEEVTDAWESVADVCEARAGDFTIPFIAAHYAYAFSRAGRDEGLAKTRETAKRLATETRGARQLVWREVGIPLLEGCMAFASGDVKRAAAELGPLLNDVGRGGGSDAQVDLFRQTHLLASGRAGERSRAREVWNARVADRKPTLLEELWLAELG